MTSEATLHWAGAEDGEALWLLGGLYVWRALDAETGGAYSLCEVQGRAGFGAPMHLHDQEDEGFYVVDGLVTLVLGEEEIQLSKGGFGLAPRRIRHGFRLDSGEATMLLLFTPGTAHEAMFAEMGEPAQTRTIPPPPDGPPDLERLAAIAGRHGTTLLGPPPGEAPTGTRSG
jgi:quercetin dioxygenase-like cupin family protein